MSGDKQEQGERIWCVREYTGKGWTKCQHGKDTFFYARSRQHAKEQFMQRGLKQFLSSYLAAFPSD